MGCDRFAACNPPWRGIFSPFRPTASIDKGAVMRLKALLCIPLIALGLTALAVLGDQKQSTGERMAVAAEKFVGMLKDDQKARATFAFDDKERTNWNFVPLQDKEKKPTR